MQGLHIFLVLAVCLLQSPLGNCVDFAKRFNELTKFAKDHGGYERSEEARRLLVELKIDMARACREGIIKEVPGFLGISRVGGTSTKAYDVPIPHSTIKENHVLPDVECPPVVRNPQTTNDDSLRLQVPESVRRMAPAHLPTFQPRVAKPIPLWWPEFTSTFDLIKQDTLNNNGYLSTEGEMAIQYLKADMMIVCKSGDMRAVGPGINIRGLYGDVTIPTKVYVLTGVPDSEEKTLPDIDCSATSPASTLEERLNPAPKTLEERINPASSYDTRPQRSYDRPAFP